MKKIAVIAGLIMLAATIAYPVFAHGPGWGRGPHMMGNWGGYGSWSQERQGSMDNLNRKFYEETADLRNELRTKSYELNALLNTPGLDAEKAKTLQKEISDLKAKMAGKRLEFDLEARKMAPESGYNRGYGWGHGRHMGGYGPRMGYGHHMGYGGQMAGYGPGSCRY